MHHIRNGVAHVSPYALPPEVDAPASGVSWELFLRVERAKRRAERLLQFVVGFVVGLALGMLLLVLVK